MKSFTVSKEVQLLQHIASDDRYRENISGVYFNCKSAIATNGHAIVARKKSQHDTATNKIIAFEKPKQKKQPVPFETFLAADIPSVTHVSASGSARVVDSQFPACDQVIPHGDVKATITFDPKLLAEMVKAMGDPKSITLEIRDVTTPIIVSSDQSGPNVAGMLRPMRRPENEKTHVNGYDAIVRLIGK